MLIRHYNALKGPKFDTIFAISAIRAIKKYKPRYILADGACDSEIIKKTIVEQTAALPQIPLKLDKNHENIEVNVELYF
mgnify:CR=1 FL=1